MPTLNEAVSKISIDQSKLQAPTLSYKKRRALQKEIIKSIITSRPAGTVIKIQEFQDATFLKSYTGIAHLLEDMQSRGEITRTQITPRQSTWSVRGELVPAIPSMVVNPELTSDPQPQSQPTPAPVEAPKEQSYTLAELEQQGMRFMFYQGDSSLPRFLEWLKVEEETKKG